MTALTPSVDALFQTAARHFGERTVALLLTGMGEDGARGLLELRKRGALTVTQSSGTCVVDGMPRSARSLDAAVQDLSPEAMIELLRTISVACAPAA